MARRGGGKACILAVLALAICAAGAWAWGRHRAHAARVAERRQLCARLGIETDGRSPFIALPRTLLHRASAADLGRSLYTDARLARLPYRTCAACHRLNEGGMDGRRHEGLLTRPVYNAALGCVFFRDGRETALTNVVRTMIEGETYGAGGPLADRVALLAKDEATVRRFQFAYEDGVTAANVTDALAEYLRTLLTSGAPLDMWCAGRTDVFTAEQKRGLDIFRRQRCMTCHDGPALGACRVSDGRKVAALRGLGLRKAYLPDGLEPDLGAVLTRMPGGALEADARAALVAFLKTL